MSLVTMQLLDNYFINLHVTFLISHRLLNTMDHTSILMLRSCLSSAHIPPTHVGKSKDLAVPYKYLHNPGAFLCNLSSDPPAPLHLAVLRAARHCLVASSLLPSVKVFLSVLITGLVSCLYTPASSSLCLLCIAIIGTAYSSFSSATERNFGGCS